MIRRMTKINPRAELVKGIITGDGHTADPIEVDRLVAEYYQSLYRKKLVAQVPDPPPFTERKRAEIFTEEDIEEVIQSSNFKKGLGPDLFCGDIHEDPELRRRFKKECKEAMNQGRLPKHLTQERLIALSKVPGGSIAKVEDTRPIVSRITIHWPI